MTEFPPFEQIEGRHDLGLVLLGDHARNTLPPDYASLGLDRAVFARHIAYDIGVEALLRRLAERLEAPAVMSTFSRLLIDPNRGEDDPTLVMKISDGAIIPGNHPISPAEIDARLNRFHRPYHLAVDDLIRSVGATTGRAPLVLSFHSFTPVWRGDVRPWHAGVLWDSDPRVAIPLIDDLRSAGDIVVGDNEPYDGALRGDCMYRHCMVSGIPHALLEVRQDLISDTEGVEEWANRLTPIFASLNAMDSLHAFSIYPSRTGPYDH